MLKAPHTSSSYTKNTNAAFTTSLIRRIMRRFKIFANESQS